MIILLVNLLSGTGGDSSQIIKSALHNNAAQINLQTLFDVSPVIDQPILDDADYQTKTIPVLNEDILPNTDVDISNIPTIQHNFIYVTQTITEIDSSSSAMDAAEDYRP